MKKSLFILLFFILGANGVLAERLHFEIEIDLTSNLENPLEFSLNDLTVDKLDIEEPSSGADSLKVEIRKGNGEVIEAKEVGFEFNSGDSPFFAPTTTASADFSYSDKIKFLKVYFKDKEVLSENIQALLCNNDEQCNWFENAISCPVDCKANADDGICNSEEFDGFCDQDCWLDIGEFGDCNRIKWKVESISFFGAGNANNKVSLVATPKVVDYVCDESGAMIKQKFSESEIGLSPGEEVEEEEFEEDEEMQKAGFFEKLKCRIKSFFGKNYNICLMGIALAPPADCSVKFGAYTYTGAHDSLGITRSPTDLSGNTKNFFICNNGKIYKCASKTAYAFATGAKDKQKIGSWTCDIKNTKWTRGCVEEDWQFALTPEKCTLTGKQKKTWTKKPGVVCAGGVSHASEEVVCISEFKYPECKGCLIPKWLGFNVEAVKLVEKICAPFGKILSTKERFELKESDGKSGYLFRVISNDGAELKIIDIYGNEIKIPLTKGKVISLGQKMKFD